MANAQGPSRSQVDCEWGASLELARYRRVGTRDWPSVSGDTSDCHRTLSTRCLPNADTIRSRLCCQTPWVRCIGPSQRRRHRGEVRTHQSPSSIICCQDPRLELGEPGREVSGRERTCPVEVVEGNQRKCCVRCCSNAGVEVGEQGRQVCGGQRANSALESRPRLTAPRRLVAWPTEVQAEVAHPAVAIVSCSALVPLPRALPSCRRRGTAGTSTRSTVGAVEKVKGDQTPSGQRQHKVGQWRLKL